MYQFRDLQFIALPLREHHGVAGCYGQGARVLDGWAGVQLLRPPLSGDALSERHT